MSGFESSLGAELQALVADAVIPEGCHTYSFLPIGFPRGKFGPVRRAPLPEVVVDDVWDKPWAGA